MKEQELRQLFDEISRMLRKEGFGWAVDDVEANIRLGRLEQRSVRLLRENEEHTDLPLLISAPSRIDATGKKAELITVLAYSEKEKLLLLLGALRQVVINLFEIEGKTSRNLMEFDGPQSVTFTDDETELPVIQLDLQDISRLGSTIETLKSLIHELESEVNAD